MDANEVIFAAVTEMLEPCSCEDTECSRNFNACKTVPEYLAKVCKIYRKVCNNRSMIFSDMVDAVYAPEEIPRIRHNLFEKGEEVTKYWAAAELLALACFYVPQTLPLEEYIAEFHREIQRIMRGSYKIEVHAVPPPKTETRTH